MLHELNHLDFLCLVLFIAITIFLGRCSAKNNTNDYLLMGKSLSLPLFIATLTSTWYGGIFGVTQIAYEKGIYVFFTQGLFWYIPYLIFAFFFAKKVRQFNCQSLPELIGLKFGDKARRLSALIIFFHALPTTYGVSLGILLCMIFNCSLVVGLSSGVLFVAIYSMMGGFRAIVKTDAWQFVFMFSAVFAVVITAYKVYGGADFLSSHLPKSHLTIDKTFSYNGVLWLLIASSSTLVHPVFYQRCLAAQSDKVAQKGILIAIGLWLLFDMATTLGGLYARAVLPDTPSEHAYLLFGLKLLPHGLKGLFIAGIAATILSTLDSFLFISGVSLSYDFCKSTKVYAHRLSILASSFVVILLGIIFNTRFEEIWLFMESIFSVGLLFPTLLALWYKKNPSRFLFPAIVFSSFFGYFLVPSDNWSVIAAHMGATTMFMLFHLAKKLPFKIRIFLPQ